MTSLVATGGGFGRTAEMFSDGGSLSGEAVLTIVVLVALLALWVFARIAQP